MKNRFSEIGVKRNVFSYTARNVINNAQFPTVPTGETL